MTRQWSALGFLSLLIASPIWAHTGSISGGLGAGVAHPFHGMDHLLAALVVGMLAATQGRQTRWGVPAAFLAGMAAGVVFGLGAGAPGWLEWAIALSVTGLGVVIWQSGRINAAGLFAVAAVAGGVHGLAHGLEAGGAAQAPALYLGGLLIATAILHAIGMGTGWSLRDRVRHAGLPVAAAGMTLLLIS